MNNAHHVHLDGAVEAELLGDTGHLVGSKHDAKAKEHIAREWLLYLTTWGFMFMLGNQEKRLWNTPLTVEVQLVCNLMVEVVVELQMYD